jgi:glycosyltransferase EpsJ
MIKVSIVIPFHNRKSFLKRCLESLKAQSLKEIEIILVNDFSSDGGEDIANAYCKEDSRFKLINLKENVGALRARWAGVRESTGYYVGFVDSDDEIDEEMYDSLFSDAHTNNADISMCGMWRSTETNRKHVIRIEYNANKLFTEKIFEKYCNSFFRTGSCCNRIYKSLIIKEPSIWQTTEKLSINEDYLVNFHTFLNAKRVTTSQKLLYYAYENPQSTVRSLSSLELTSEILKTFNTVVDTFSSSNKFDLILKFYNNILKSNCHFNNLKYIKNQNLKRYYNFNLDDE